MISIPSITIPSSKYITPNAPQFSGPEDVFVPLNQRVVSGV